MRTVAPLREKAFLTQEQLLAHPDKTVGQEQSSSQLLQLLRAAFAAPAQQGGLQRLIFEERAQRVEAAELDQVGVVLARAF